MSLPGPRPRILVIDDEANIARVIVWSLKDYEVVTLSDSREALALLRKPDEKFVAIFLDLIMPHVNGMELFKTLQAEGSPHLPKIVITTGGDGYEAVRIFMREAGCHRDDDPRPFILKPFTVDQIRAAIRKVASKNGHHQ